MSEVEQCRTAGGNQEEEGGGGDQELRPQDTHLQLAPRVHQSISIREFKEGVASSAPESCSTPAQSADLQRAWHMSQVALEKEPWACLASPSLLTAPGGRRVLSQLDDGSGRTSPERVMILWTEEGIRNGGEILQLLDFSLDERLSLADLTLALDNELLLSGNAIHQAALISYRHEIQHLQEVCEAACRQRDKLKADLDQADHRNLELVREVDDRHASMETLNQCQIRQLQQDFREQLVALRGRAEQESEALLQQAEAERAALHAQLQLLRAQEAELKEDRSGAVLENQHLHQELSNVKQQLFQAQNATEKLHTDLQQLLYHKFGGVDPAGAAVGHEERFTEIVKEYQLQCRELRDRNDELSSELELLKSQKKISGSTGADNTTSWSGHTASPPLLHNTESDSDDFDMNCSSASVRKDLEPSDSKTVLPTGVSIQTELALEQLKQKHKEEMLQLHIEMETQVNFYKRSLQLVRQSVEVERKDICQAFKLEISELEEQKGEVEQQVKQLKETVDRLLSQLQHRGGGAEWSSEQERRLQLEQTELEQNFAREISNLVQQLSAEKEEQEAELKLMMDQEVQLVRRRCCELKEELEASQEKCSKLEETVSFLQSLGLGEEKLQQRRRSEEQLLVQVCQPQGGSPNLQGDHREATESCRPPAQQEAQLQTKEQRAVSFCSQLEALQEVQRSREKFLQTDQKERTVASDLLQPHLHSVPEGWGSRRSVEKHVHESLQQEEHKSHQLCSLLEEQQKEVLRLQEQNSSSTRLVEQEIGSLRDSQMGASSSSVLALRTQRSARTRTGEEEWQRTVEEEFEEEKWKMRRQLEDLEQLVLELEEVAGGGSRSQLEEVRSENAALQERLHLLQQEVQTLEEDLEERRRRLQEVEREHQRSREEEERLQHENTRCREEVLDLSSRNLQLSDENATLSARLRGDQEAVQMLQERLATVSKEQEEEEATVQRLRDAALQRERETLQLQAARTQDREQLQGELGRYREQLAQRCHLEAELSCATLKVCWLEDEKTKLLQEADERNKKVEQLQHTLVSMETHVELLHTQQHQQQLNHGQHVSELQSKLQEAESQVELLEMSVRKLEKDQAAITLQETQQLRLQNQELQNQLQRQQEEVELLQLRVGEEQRRSQQLEEVLRLQSQQRDSQLSLKEGQFEKVLLALQQGSEELQVKLRGVRLLLQEKVHQLKEELVKSSGLSAHLKDVCCENAQLMKALSVTEQRQKQAEKKNLRLEEKMAALQQLLRDVVMATLTM